MSLTPEDRAGYAKLCAELETMAKRLSEISEGGHGDMEGADAPEFFISEILWADCETAARYLRKTARRIEERMK